MKKVITLSLTMLLLFTLVACGNSQKRSDLVSTMSEIEKNVSLNNMIDLSKEDLFDYYGIMVEEDVAQFAAKINDTGVKSDELVMIEATDENAAKRVKEKLDARYTSKINENASYNVEELAVIEKCKVDVKGNYVSMLISPEVTKIEEIYNASFK